MRLEDIGFYTLSDKRAKNISGTSPIMRLEIILSDKCNLKCPYCRGLPPELKGELPIRFIEYFIDLCKKHQLQNIRFSGGEPTLYPYLQELVWECKKLGIKRIGISTNGTAEIKFYKELMSLGVNDFSISLDAGCCAIGEIMSGGNKDAWEKASEAIAYLSRHSYVTVGIVFNELNYERAIETISYIDKLNPSDIRVLSSAQYNKVLISLVDLSNRITNKYRILKYRLNNFRKKRNVRGIRESDSNRCHLVLDDLAIAGQYHFPCIIYLREGGKPVGIMNQDFRQERSEWFKNHDSFQDKICLKNCLDVCIDFNNKAEYYKRKES